MPNTEPKKYQKIEEAEIDLVVKCKDSHEFYEKYMEVFADKKKGIESIGKIWKRRSEFIRKRQETAARPVIPAAGVTAAAVAGQAALSPELEKLIAAQNAVLAELAGVMKEHLKVSRGIAALLQKNQVCDEYSHKPEEGKKPEEDKTPDDSRKHRHEKPPGPIVVGS